MITTYIILGFVIYVFCVIFNYIASRVEFYYRRAKWGEQWDLIQFDSFDILFAPIATVVRLMETTVWVFGFSKEKIQRIKIKKPKFTPLERVTKRFAEKAYQKRTEL